MRAHPLLSDPKAVLVAHWSVTAPVPAQDFSLAAREVLSALEVALEGERPVIKPNLTVAEKNADPESGITTHPAFIEGIIEYLVSMGSPAADTYVVEDPVNGPETTPRTWAGTGMLEVAERTGCQLHWPSEGTCVVRDVPNPLAHDQIRVSGLAVSTDSLLINVPKLKNHNLGITTLCLKNQMGLVAEPQRHFCRQAWVDLAQELGVEPDAPVERDRALHERYQEKLAYRLVDVAQIVCPKLNLVEGIVAREGTGFQRGRNRPLGLVIAGTNMVAVDAVASYLVGYDPARLVYLQVASKAGLGCSNLDQLALYRLEGGRIVPCQTLKDLVADPPFWVISGISGEELPDW